MGSALLALAGLRAFWGFLSFGTGLFVLATIVQEYAGGMRVWMGRGSRGPGGALVALVRRNQRRYGGYIIHGGVVLVFAGITSVGLWKQETSRLLHPGDSVDLAGHTIVYRDFWVQSTPHRKVEGVRLLVRDRAGRDLREMLPERSFFATFPDEPVSEIALFSRLRGDLYAVSEEVLPDGSARVHLFWNPLIALIWIGGIVMALGTVIAVLPSRLPEPVRATVPENATGLVAG